MVEFLDVDEGFDFKDIFPTCMEKYNSATAFDKIQSRNVYIKLCEEISKKLNINNFNFNISCKDLSSYLESIINTEKVACCKYFSYRLKDELEGLNPSCGGEKECYKKMKEAKDSTNKTLSNACKEHVVDLKDGTHYIMNELNLLYNYFKDAKNNSYNNSNQFTCTFVKECLKIYNKLLEINRGINNISLNEVLKMFKQEYDKHYDKFVYCLSFSKIIHYTSWAFGGTFILTVAISVTIYIWYMYTPYASYLQQIILKLKKILNKKSNNVKNLTNSFEITYKNLIDENYMVSNNSADYY
ncbi:variable surface protein [Plasmodium gonderi]|uniref:Variable surface protein n=1 Tax=Plasmodium gonderi TaxID=77519 RepID=A0A1Y1JSJ4_PLAGO|nr:variable surface protein [Plasmodium gonderi]GAW84425.1 variable surface protein [Plasmodium gonderi]